jgi:hypothetical protein
LAGYKASYRRSLHPTYSTSKPEMSFYIFVGHFALLIWIKNESGSETLAIII